MIHRMFIPAHDYDLDATFSCGQIFRWKLDTDGSWRGFVAGHAVRLKAQPGGMIAEIRVRSPVGLVILRWTCLK